jgi:hypothetical protein
MIETLINSLKSEVGSQIVGQTNLPSGNLDKVFSIIGDVTKKEVTGQLKSGNLSTVMNLFSNKTNNSGANALQSSITTGIVSNLVSKLGLSQQVSNTIAQVAVPALMNLITKKNSETPDDDPSPLNDIFGSITKGSTGNMLGGVAKNILGGFFKKK